MKLNDWIVANINNPEFSVSDFRNVSGLDLNNTLFLSKDEYKKSKFITDNPIFKDNSTGLFDEKLFDLFYETQASKFDDFVEDNSIYEREYNFWDIRANSDSKIKDPNFLFIHVPNPDRLAYGTSGRNEIGLRKLSRLELAETQQIKDYKTGKFLKDTPNDMALFKNPFKYIGNLFSPLVLATYDEDGTHIDPTTGQEVKHKKGEPILNENGTYFAETLGGRSPRDKQFITNKDLITVDGTGLNKYDFFDSDDIKKDPWKVVEDTIASIAPMIFLGPYGWIYSGLIISRELSKALPMLVEFASWRDNDVKWANTLAGIGLKFSRGTSEFARENMFSFENIGALVADVALQWGQQKAIAKGISKLKLKNSEALTYANKRAAEEYYTQYRKALTTMREADLVKTYGIAAYTAEDLSKFINSGEFLNTIAGKASLAKYLPAAERQIQKATKLGQDLSLVYMAIISNTDVYDSAIQHGASRREAAALALTSSAFMFSVDKYLHLGEMFFDDQSAEFRRQLTQVFKNGADDVIAELEKVGTLVSDKTMRRPLHKIINSFNNKLLRSVPNFIEKAGDRSLGFLGKAFGEGLEEVTEELATDFSKTLYEMAADLGWYSTSDLGSWDNMLPRYAMNFLGGFIGGGIFYGVDVYNNPKTLTQEVDRHEILHLISQGKTKEIIQLLDKKYKLKNAIFGNYELSYDPDSKHTVSADENHKSQAEIVYNNMRNAILSIDLIMNNHNLKASEDLLFDKLVLSLANLLGLKGLLGDMSYFTYYQQDYQSVVNDIVNIQQELNDITTDHPDAETTQRINDLQTKLAEKLKLRDEFQSGERSLDYLDKLLWMVDTNASYPFITLTKDQYALQKFGKLYDQLSDSEKSYINRVYNPRDIKESIDLAWTEYKEFRSRLSDAIKDMSDQDINDALKYLQQEEQVKSEFSSLFDGTDVLRFGSEYSSKKLPAYEGVYGKYDEESDEEFKKRTEELLENESDEDYRNRTINKHFIAVLSDRKLTTLTNFLNKLSGLNIDSNTRRRLSLIVNNRIEDVANSELIKYVRQTLSSVEQKENIIDKNKKDLLSSVLTDLVTEFSRNPGNINFKTAPSENLYDLIREFVKDRLSISQKRIEMFPEIYDVDADENETIKDILVSTSDEVLKLQLQLLIDDGYSENMKFIDLQQGLFNPNSDNVGFISQIDDITNGFYQAVRQVFSNPLLNVLQKIDLNIETKNVPARNLLQVIATRLDLLDLFESIEDALDTIYQMYQEKGVDQFTLTDEQIEALTNAKSLLRKAESVIYSAKNEESQLTPIGQNKQINKIVKDKPGLFTNVEPLLELEVNAGNSLMYELEEYISEIDEWVQKSRNNDANIIAAINKSNVILNESLNDFFNELKNVTINGTSLLGDIDSETDTKTVIINANRLKTSFDTYINEKIKSGKTREEAVSEVLNEIKSLIITNDSEISEQSIAKLNEKLTISPYDKLIWTLCFLTNDYSEFHKKFRPYVRELINQGTLASLTFVTYLIDSYLNNTEIFNEIFEKLEIDKPVYLNTAIITGSGGTGKTSVIAKYFADNYKSLAIAGPSESQITNLSRIIGVNKVNKKLSFKNIHSLLSYFIKDDILSEMESEIEVYDTEKEKKYFLTFVHHSKSGSRTPGFKLKDRAADIFKVIEPQDIPELLIVDEATYLAHPMAEVLGLIGKHFGFKTLLIGDEAQNNYRFGLDKEVGFGFRTPRLDLSLRVKNIHQSNNQKQVQRIFDNYILENSGSNEQIVTALKACRFKYYLSDTDFAGTLITNEINDSLVNSIKLLLTTNKDRVIYVGDVGSDLYRTLNQQLGNKVIPLTEQEVQGQEGKYVIVDVNWGTLTGPKYSGLYEYILKFNTLLTRSERGTIFIDNGLTKVISKPTQSTVNTDIKGFSSDQMDQLNEQYLNSTNFLDSYNSKPETEEKTEPESEEETLEEKEDVDEIFDGTKANDEEFEEDTSDEEVTHESKEVKNSELFRLYSYINTLGVKRSTEKIAGSKYDSHTWYYEDTKVKRDVGIFMDHDVSSGKEKNILAKAYLRFKNFLIYYYSKENKDDKLSYLKLFTQQELNNWFGSTDLTKIYLILESAKYFAEAKVPSEYGEDSFVGLSTADPNKCTIKINNQQRFVRVYLLLNVGNEVYEVTIGSAASPETWANKENFNSIAKAVSEKEGRNEADVRKELRDKIKLYKEQLQKLLNDGPTEINKVTFGENTEKSKPLDGKISLGAFDGEYDEFDARSSAIVVSPIYIVTQTKLPGLTLEESKKYRGKGLIYVSADPSLTPNKLKEEYEKQGSDSHRIRRFIVDNKGVSFFSLFNKDWKKRYDGFNKNGFPFVLSRLGGRMFLSMWNFRARLNNFLNDYDQYFKEYTEDEINEVLTTEAEVYSTNPENLETALNDRLKDDRKKAIWKSILDFNKTSQNREFRLGTDVRGNGLNVGTLKGSKNLFKDLNLKEDGVGIYINPRLARYYQSALNHLFNEVLYKIIEKPSGISENDELTKVEGWGKVLGALTVLDADGNQISMNVSEEANTMSMVPIVLKEMFERLISYRNNNAHFTKAYQEGKYKIFIENTKTDQKYEVDVVDLLQNKLKVIPTQYGVNTSSVNEPGVVFVINEGVLSNTVLDERLFNLFDVMFHGLLGTNKFNDFTGDEKRATVADFKYGIFVDPGILATKSESRESELAYTSADKAFFLINILFESPICYFSLSEKLNIEEDITNEEEKVEEETNNVLEEQDPAINTANEYIRTNNIKGGEIKNLPAKNRSLETTLTDKKSKNIITDKNWLVYPIKFDEDTGVAITLNTVITSKGYLNPKFVEFSNGEFTFKATFNGKQGTFKINLHDYYDGDDTIYPTIKRDVDDANKIRLTEDDEKQKIISQYNDLLTDVKNSNGYPTYQLTLFSNKTLVLDSKLNLKTIIKRLTNTLNTPELEPYFSSNESIKNKMIKLRDDAKELSALIESSKGC